MEEYIFEKDIVIACKRAESFPEGVQEAFETLHAAIPFSMTRKFMSFSWMNASNEIIYLAGAEILEGESFPELETFILKKGKYRGTIIENFIQDIPQMGLLFQELCKDPDLDPAGYCVEWYFNEKDVKCFVKLKD
ncbi:transcriptional regulator [Lacihabitans sp. LS3-19]|uniref:transcriptional regulator n=1 Tax=Lacihabitans sp. LS3-19 TaxID=2487335 RepID=UPI0020CBDB93|nr:transcriptional regulator [Lacihabitans sp. LS3-19]MCP9767761.1 transcriptional regulator [Lacihabitans sp. LS3-19]